MTVSYTVRLMEKVIFEKKKNILQLVLHFTKMKNDVQCIDCETFSICNSALKIFFVLSYLKSFAVRSLTECLCKSL